MSRRKQSNPKPFNKGDCSDTTDEMTADSRDSKDLSPNDLSGDEQHHSDELQGNRQSETDVEMMEQRRHVQHDNDIHDDVDMPLATTQTPSPPQYLLPSEEVIRSPSITNSNASKSPKCAESNENAKGDSSNAVDAGNEQSTAAANLAQEQRVTRSPSNEPNMDTSTPATSPTSNTVLPKLRLNALLASDPALKPDAKDLKAIHEETQTKNRIAAAAAAAQQLPPPPALTSNKQEDTLEALMNVQQQPQPQQQSSNVMAPESVLKTAPPTAEIAPRLKVFMCLPCGIGFSSPSTLEAHQAYYCSHRNKDLDADSTSLATVITEKSSAAAVNASSGGSLNTATANVVSTEPSTKSIKTGKQYACTQCSYSADKKVSLNRHMRMHQSSPALSANTSATINGGGAGGGAHDDSGTSQQTDRYCSDCDIRFNNVKTYRAHKLHYCSSRRTEGQLTPKLEVSTATAAKVPAAISPQTRTKTPTPAMLAAAAAAAAVSLQATPPQPFLALPTNPILIIPCSLIRAASWIPGPLTTSTSGIANPESTCFMLENGALKPLATALNMSALSSNATTPTPANITPNPNAPHPNVSLSNAESNTRSAQMSSHAESQQHLSEKNNTNRHLDGNEAPMKRKDVSSSAPTTTTTTTIRESAPLDLSLRRSPIVGLCSLPRQRLLSASSSSYTDAEQPRLDMDILFEAGKENLSLDDAGHLTPEQIVCAPSLPNSPSMSPSPKRRAISPRSSGAGSVSSMSPPANVTSASLAAAAAAAAAGNMLDLPLRSMLPADLALKLSESNIMNPLLAKQNLELALKLSAAAAAAANSAANSGAGAQHAELAAVAAAAAGKTALLGLPGAASSPAVQPQIYVKQGVSKCKECNIVFCKYENYLAHKQHYCSARNQDGVNDVDIKTSANTSPGAAGASAVETAPVAYQQLICAACGIKYTSLDNLRAHQNYYCPKGGGTAGAAVAAAAVVAAETVQLPLPKEKCSKCKSMHEVGLPCPPPSTTTAQHMPSAANATPNQNSYKCPVCDAVSLTASDSRKHMETHGTVKAFRCSICRYKGNTLRGMRTHIRMHFDKKTSDFNEEHYMSCILDEEGGMEIPSVATLSQEHLAQQIAAVQQQQHHHQQQQQQQHLQHVAALQTQQQQQQQQQQQVYNCDLCNYSSSYKGNVLRHMKLVHPHVNINSPSISPESGDMDVTESNALSGSLNGDGRFTIKTEPMEHISNANVNSQLAKLHDSSSSGALSTTLSAPPPLTSATTMNNVSAEQMPPHIKTEPLDIVGGDTLPHTTPPPPLPPPTLSSPLVIGPPPPLNSSPDENSAAAAAAMNQKYCQTCDISFNYMKTYLAHKQYYCKNKLRRPEANDSPSPNAAVLPITAVASPNSLLLLQKNKENLQQEAAI